MFGVTAVEGLNKTPSKTRERSLNSKWKVVECFRGTSAWRVEKGYGRTHYRMRGSSHSGWTKTGPCPLRFGPQLNTKTTDNRSLEKRWTSEQYNSYLITLCPRAAARGPLYNVTGQSYLRFLLPPPAPTVQSNVYKLFELIKHPKKLTTHRSTKPTESKSLVFDMSIKTIALCTVTFERRICFVITISLNGVFGKGEAVKANKYIKIGNKIVCASFHVMTLTIDTV